MKATHELLSAIINEIDKTIIIKSAVEESANVYILNSCNTLWLTLNKTITIDSVEYQIIDIQPNEWIKVSGSVIPAVKTFTIYPPFFFYGTVLAHLEQMNIIKNGADKLPMIWLHEITSEESDTDPTSIFDRTSDCDLYFLTDADFTNWLQPQHYRYAILPMLNLIDSFIITLTDAPNVSDKVSFTIMNHAKFGVYLESKGHVKSIFADKLSGSQLKIKIPFLQDMLCEDC